jgi:hypothetical protein
VNLGLSGDVRVDLTGDGEDVETFLRKTRAGGNWLIEGIVEDFGIDYICRERIDDGDIR